jgi:hypothetical protein
MSHAISNCCYKYKRHHDGIHIFMVYHGIIWCTVMVAAGLIAKADAHIVLLLKIKILTLHFLLLSAISCPNINQSKIR